MVAAIYPYHCELSISCMHVASMHALLPVAISACSRVASRHGPLVSACIAESTFQSPLLQLKGFFNHDTTQEFRRDHVFVGQSPGQENLR